AGVLQSGFAPHAQVEMHGMNGTQWQNAFDDQAKKGLGPVMAVATGPFGSAGFAAGFEKMSPLPLPRAGIGPNDFDNLNAKAQPNSILSWAGIFGTPGDPRYIGIWRSNPKRIVWNVSRLPPTEDQQWFEASNYQWARQVFSVYSPDLDQYI